MANQQFIKVLNETITEKFEVQVKLEDINKPLVSSDVLGKKSFIQMKQQTIEDLKAAPPSSMSQEDKDAQIYDFVFSQLKKDNDWHTLPKKYVQFLESNTSADKKMPIQYSDLQFKYSEYNAIVIALRNLSGLACAYTGRPSSMYEAMKKDNILEWYKSTFLAHALLGKDVIKTKKDKKDLDPELHVTYTIDNKNVFESRDKAVCMFLNEMTGYGHLYCKEAVA